MSYKTIVPIGVFVVGFLGHALYFKIVETHNAAFWWSAYVQMRLYFVSFSLGLAFSYGAFSFLKLRHSRTTSKGATVGSAILAFLVWFTSCCGAPLLAAVLGILGVGASAVIFPPPAVALLTIVLVSLGFLWLRKKTAGAKLVCTVCGTKTAVPIVHCGPGVLGPENGKLYCPCINEGHTEIIEMQQHCGQPMKHTK